MTMGWMETIRFLGLDLMVVTVFAVASLYAAACVLKAAWRRIPRVATGLDRKQAALERNPPQFGAAQTASIRSTMLRLSTR